MHRSGTTLVSKMLDASGVFQGELKDHNNEAFHFLSINQQVLESAGYNWLNPGVPDKEHWYKINQQEIISEHFRVQTQNRLKQRFTVNKLWGWKDPRNTFTLDMWLSLFPEARVIHVIRDGIDVAQSLKNRNDVKGEVFDERLNSLDFNFKLWEQYVNQASSYKAKAAHFLEVKYEDVLKEDEKTIKSIEALVGVSLNKGLTLINASKLEKAQDQHLINMAASSDAYNLWYGQNR